ncbi:hypothetical protein IW261DRAFT_795861 [Armillaria novae-zelandiae]|uniref:Uncharacterized protein n=1 Tax=Armillaria novae-zelandiae TaxID=153914 RepID=A0AA39PNI3_9AGAR|nr:hypothetical protein IW261DRAFT_795861 [Armillaria novae-zelandiae]
MMMARLWALQTMPTVALAASIAPFYNICFDLTCAKPPEDRKFQHTLQNIIPVLRLNTNLDSSFLFPFDEYGLIEDYNLVALEWDILGQGRV